jgi:NAD-dependent DNA ligase
VRTAHGGQPFANPRGAAAGTLRAKERAYTVPMTFFGYGLLPPWPTPRRSSPRGWANSHTAS